MPKFPDEEQGPSGSARNQKRDDKEGEINGETVAHRKYREVRNREKRVGSENHVVKAREKKFLCNSFRWDEADAKVRNYLFLCLGAEGQRQTQQKQPGFVLHAMTTRELITTLEDIFVTTRTVTDERYNFICRKQKLIWEDREGEWVHVHGTHAQ